MNYGSKGRHTMKFVSERKISLRTIEKEENRERESLNPLSDSFHLYILRGKVFRYSCLIIAIIIVFVSSIILFSFMEDESWSKDNDVRQRVLLIALILFLMSTALCLYVWNEGRPKNDEQIQLLIVESPPSYDSIIIQEPPPAYITVVKCVQVVQQETTG